MSWLPTFLQNLKNATYGMWNSPTPGLHPDGSVTPGEGGVDIGSPQGTPVYALADGPIMAAGYWNDIGHGVVTQRVNVPGQGNQDLYYQHIVLDSSINECQGNCTQYVKRGQLIGTIGSFNEIEMGFNAKWGGVWGTNHPGPWISDPRPWLNALLNGSPTPVTGTGGTGTTTANPTSSSGLNPFQGVIDQIQPLLKWISDPVRVVKLVTGIALVLLGFFMLVAPEATKEAIKHPTALLGAA